MIVDSGRLAQIEKRYREASPGPYKYYMAGDIFTVSTTDIDTLMDIYSDNVTLAHVHTQVNDVKAGNQQDKNGKFFACAWEDIKDLLDTINNLIEVNNELEEERKNITGVVESILKGVDHG